MVEKLLYKVLQSYYERGMTQQEIANRYGISRMKVNRLISKALEDKIVQIKINLVGEPTTELENRLEQLFGLNEVIVVVPESQSSTLLELGEAAADYLSNRLAGNETIGITWGRAMLATINAMHATDSPNTRVVQIIGGLGNPEAEIHGTDLVIRLAQTLGAKARPLNSPGLVKTKEMRDALVSNIQVSDTLALAENANLALVGIGALSDSALIVQNSQILSASEAQRLNTLGAVGDIGLRYFDSGGTFIDDEINTRVVGLTAEQITRIPRKIAVAGGSKKHAAVLAAARGKLIDTLITDIDTAQFLLLNAENP